ncbi:MAG: response regulator, partial [Magnetococcales bacterium]|nr:response regulator [Magnetococcales bacterium]
GKQAVDLVARESLDGVLMDWKMPVMDGVECMRRIRDEAVVHTPAMIMVTAFGREEALNEAQRQGVGLQYVVTKPVTPSVLLESIGEALGRGVVREGGRRSERVDPAREAKAKLRGARVLLVEDNDMNQELAMELLGEAGFEVVVAGNGREALDRLAADDRFDGVLMDCQMPVMDGYSATRAIRENPAWGRMPVIAMTANAMAGDREKVIAAGMNDHIAKPLDVVEMFVTLAKWIVPAVSRSGGCEAVDLSGVGVVDALPGEASSARVGVDEIPCGIPDLDVETGLKRVVGKKGLYVSMLRKYRVGQRDVPARIRAALADGDHVTAEREAHTLKGTSGNIGATRIQSGAAQVEAAIKEGRQESEVMDLLVQVEGMLGALIQALDDALPAEVEAEVLVARPVLDLEGLRVSAGALVGFLADDNSEAADVWHERLGLFKQAMPEQWRQVGEAIEVFDFEGAIVVLREALRVHGVEV